MPAHVYIDQLKTHLGQEVTLKGLAGVHTVYAVRLDDAP